MSDQENKMETDKVADDDSVKTEEEKPEEKEENEKEPVKEEEEEDEAEQNEEKSEETESEKDKKEEEKPEANEVKEKEEPVKKKKKAKKEEAPAKEVPSTPKKESDVPLYDQPLEMSGKRDRKKVERYVQETKKEELSIEGTGVPLGEIPFIDSMISKMAVEELKVLHRVAFNRPGSGAEIKKNLRKFNGFPYNKDDKKYQSKQMTVERILMPEIKKMLMVLGLERSGNKGDAVERLMAFMMQPEDFGKKPLAPTKKGKGRGRPKKGTGKKQNNTSRDDSDGSRSESEQDEEEEEEEEEDEEQEDEEEEEEEKPKKTPGRKPAGRKKTPAKRTPAPKRTPASKRTKQAQASDDSDSDDEPLAKKVKQPPTDAELKVMVKKILEGANLEEVTMKSVCRQVYDSYPDFDLTHKKVFIKETVKSIIS